MLGRFLNWLRSKKVILTKSGAALTVESEPIPREDMARLKSKMCEFAEYVSSQFGTRLDYSVGSVQQVERILGVIHEEYSRTGSEDGLHGLALEFGAYIVAVIERHYGPAKWERDHPEFGEDSFPLTWMGSTLFPVSWCTKRFFDGPGDDVWCKFQVIILNHASNKT